MPLVYLRLGTLLVAAVLVVAAPSPCRAHDVDFTCKIQGDGVELTAYYDDDLPADNAKVTVTEVDSRRLVAEGKTDARGKWSFARPAPGRYEVLLNAGPGKGHTKRRIIIIRQEDAEGAVVSPGPSREEFTRFPWLKLAIGIGTILGLGAAVVLALRLGRKRPAQSSSPRG